MKKVWLTILAAPVVISCAHDIPDIVLDEESFAVASLDAPEAAPVEFVETFKPLPLPGQLKEIDGEGDETNAAQSPHETIDQANADSQIEPAADNYVNAIQVYPFVEGALYQLYSAPEQVTDIALQEGEELISVSAGDTVRWVVGDTVSGAGQNERVHILVKPFAPGLTTNLIITTDKRAYYLELRSFRKTYMAAVSWRYPHEELITRKIKNERSRRNAEETVARSLSPDKLNFRYEISGDKPHWRPLRAFDDGKKVYIQFPARISQGEAPPLFVLGRDGGSELVNYRMRGAYYVVDRLFAAAELRLGEDNQQVVRIIRSDLRERKS